MSSRQPPPAVDSPHRLPRARRGGLAVDSPHQLTPARRGALVAAAVAIAARIVLAAVFNGPSLEPDTSSYQEVGRALFHLNAQNYIGLRTPGYPLVLKVFGEDLQAVWAAQSVLGVAACLFVYWTVLRLTGRARLALAASLVLTFSADVLFFEGEILTEAVTLFLLTASLALFTRLVLGDGRRWPGALLLGVLTAAAALTRPETALLIVVWPVAWLMVGRPDRAASRGRSRGLAVAAMAIPGIIAVIGWSSVNAEIVGVFSPTTLTGFNLVDHLGSSVDQAPQRYATVRDIYVRARNKSLASGHGDYDISFGALADMQRATGKGVVSLSQELSAMSLGVIAHHPLGYLWVTAKSWARSWDAPLYWQPERLHPDAVRSGLEILWKVERPLRIALNIVFLGLCLLALTKRFRRAPGAHRQMATGLMGVVLVMSIPQSLLANGENGRYLFPYYPMIVVALAVAAEVWLQKRREAKATAGPATA